MEIDINNGPLNLDGLTIKETKENSGKWEYASIAFLVDRDDFLSRMKVLRKKWGLDKLVAYDGLADWRSKIYKAKAIQQQKYEQAWHKFQNKWKISLGDTPPEKARSDWQEVHRILPQWDFYFDIYSVRDYFHRPFFFHQIITRALVCGEIRDQDYFTAYLEPTVVYSSSGWFTGIPPSSSAWIAVTKETREKDLLNTFRRLKGMPLASTYESYQLRGKPYSFDTITNIVRDRKWYWLKKAKLSYGEIRKKHIIDYPEEEITRDGVIQAVKQYENHLTAKV